MRGRTIRSFRQPTQTCDRCPGSDTLLAVLMITIIITCGPNSVLVDAGQACPGVEGCCLWHARRVAEGLGMAKHGAD
jgi:hypothetical protein